VKLIIVSLELFLVLLVEIFAGQSVQVLMKGRVIDELSGKPAGVTIEFRSMQGKKFKIQSNSITGAYEQVFNAGDTIEVILSNWDIARKIDTMIIENSSKYKEFNKDFYITRFTEGDKVFSVDAFQNHDSGFLPPGINKIEELYNILLFNRNVKFKLIVSAHDTFIKPVVPSQTKQTEKKKKKKKEDIKPHINIPPAPDPEEIKQLVDSRISNVNDYLNKKGKYSDRLSVTGDYSIGENPSGADTNPVDIIIVVQEIKNVFK
jgi:hypothetical protein